ncbi:hypothetical protein [Paenibacillus silviterrae]|uniref:hypothetical protein n=1 Tax=Paenibacillus silviterrae TaxID=3242194 RepID=UPI0025429A89|nr:hypothetical protein [Paenibacillus chinjuensis]
MAQVLQQSGVGLWERPAGLITPKDFWEHPELQPVYEGLLFKYPLLDRSRRKYLASVPEGVLTPRTSTS